MWKLFDKMCLKKRTRWVLKRLVRILPMEETREQRFTKWIIGELKMIEAKLDMIEMEKRRELEEAKRKCKQRLCEKDIVMS